MRSYATRGTAIGAIAILLCLGSMSTALAQAKGGGRAAPTGAAAGSPGGGGTLVLYGTAGNCPPTTACPSNDRRPRAEGKTICTRWETTRTVDGRRIRKCVER